MALTPAGKSAALATRTERDMNLQPIPRVSSPVLKIPRTVRQVRFYTLGRSERSVLMLARRSRIECL